VASDVLGKSGRRMLEALIGGERDPAKLAQLALGRLREKIPQLREALRGLVQDHHLFLLRLHLDQLDGLDSLIDRLSQRVLAVAAGPPPTPEPPGSPPPPPGGEPPPETPKRVAEPVDARVRGRALPDQVGPDGTEPPAAAGLAESLRLLQSIPGIKERTAEVIVAEIGTDMRVFATADHLASWAGLCPGNHQSAGRRYSGRMRPGDRWLKQALTQAAWAVSRTRGSWLQGRYLRWVSRLGKKRAVMAMAHRLLELCHWVLSHRTPYRQPTVKRVA
jgi:transposase